MPLSQICEGVLIHRRSAPVEHRFDYAVWMLLIDIDSLVSLDVASRLFSVDRPNLLELRTNDYLKGPGTLRRRVEHCFAREGLSPTRGPILLLTTPRTWGHSFNPVSFFICLDSSGRHIERVVAEVENTPWKERHVYLLCPSNTGETVQTESHKVLHVSPFNDMNQSYRWRFHLTEGRIRVSMTVTGEGSPHFCATLDLVTSPLTAGGLRRGALAYPMQSARTLVRIYTQALRLWLKRAPVYTHPDKRAIHDHTRTAG